MMKEGGGFVENGSVIRRSNLGLNFEGSEGRERLVSRRFDGEEREIGGYLVMRVEDSQLRMMPMVNDRSLSTMDDETATKKFQWPKMLLESRNSEVDVVAKDLRGEHVDYGRTYARVVENSLPVPISSERIRDSLSYGRSAGTAEVHGVITRNASGPLSEDGVDFSIREYPPPPPRLTRDMSRKYYNSPEMLRKHYEGGSCNRCCSGYSPPHCYREFNREDSMKHYGEGSHVRSHSDYSPPPCIGETSRRHYEEGSHLKGHSDYSPPHCHREMSRRHYKEESRHICPSNYSPPHWEREVSRNHYEEGNLRGFCSNDNSPQNVTPRSQSSAQCTPFVGNRMENDQGLHPEVLHHQADGFRNVDSIQPARCERSHQIVHSKAGASIHPFSDEAAVRYSGAKQFPNVDRPGYCIHPEGQRSRKVYPSALPEDDYQQHIGRVQDYEDQENNAMDHTLHRLGNIGNSHKHVVMADRLQSYGRALKEEPTLGTYDVSQPANDSEYDGIVLHAGNSFLEHGIQAIESHESLPPEKDRVYEMHPHHMDYEHQNFYVPKTEECILDENTQHTMESGDFGFHGQFDRMLKRKQRFSGKMTGSKRRASTCVGSYDNGPLTAEPNEELVPQARKFSHRGQFQATENEGLAEAEPGQEFCGLSEGLRSRLGKPDIKKRLKHPHAVHSKFIPHSSKSWKKNTKHFVKPPPYATNTTSATQPYGNATGYHLKKKLKAAHQSGLGPPATQDSHVTHCEANIEKQQTLSTKNFGDTKEASRSQEAENPEHLKFKVKPDEKDLPEDSQGFRRKVDEWFLKCILHLNAYPAQQNGSTEQGKAGFLKCIICSSSREFKVTKDTALHAFKSPKVGLRAPHLGFHRALCVLMGWDSAVGPSGQWVCRSLSDAEACALKEDIIIWPPVVVVHNRRGNNLKKQVKFSKENVGNVLKDEGFDVRNAKVWYGRAGNPNVMVVTFTGTLSGLEEAEKLHNFFSKKKRGRIELQQAIGAASGSKDAPQVPEDNIKRSHTISGVKNAPELPVGNVKHSHTASDNKDASQVPEHHVEDSCTVIDLENAPELAVDNVERSNKVSETKDASQVPEHHAEDSREVSGIENAPQSAVNNVEHSHTVGDSKELPVDKVVGLGHSLYGYLGTIEDLVKIQYNAKLHCARRKKEILASGISTT